MIDIGESLALGFETAFAWVNLLYCFVGVFLGTFIGVLPGVGALTATSMLLPITFYLDPTAAIVMIAGVFYGAEYGGSTASILLNLPGTPSNAITCLDGYPMAQQGRAGVALFMTTIASFVGGTLGVFLLVGLAPAVFQLTLAFGPTEYVAVMVFGLVAAATITQGSALKGIAMVVLGLLAGCVRIDVETGIPRYDFGFFELYEGISIVPVAIGLFGVSEVIFSINAATRGKVTGRISLRSMVPTRDDVRRSVMPILRGSGVGCWFGPLPGTGPLLASFIAYALEKKVSKRPERFGSGAIEGIASPEAANNAAIQTAFIPTLTMAIPGSATLAIILGALMMHGIIPGPSLMSDHPDLFWGLVVSFWIGNVLLLILNIPMIGIWVRLLQIPYRFLYPAIVGLICIGAYSLNNSVFDIGLVLLFGVFGYVMRSLGFQPAPFLLGFVLGPMMEENLRRAMLLGRGDFATFLESPISAGLLAVTLAWLVWMVVARLRGLAAGPVPEAGGPGGLVEETGRGDGA